MRIVQISDLHIAAEGEMPNGIDVRHQFQQVLQDSQKFNPELLVLSGDLSYQNASLESYQWIKEHLEHLDLDYFVIPGNHDHSMLIADVFPVKAARHEDQKFYFFQSLNGFPFFFLDSGDGTVGEKQLIWMKEKMALLNTDQFFVFMHHPPLMAGVPHMDNKYFLKDMRDFQKVIRESGKFVYVFTGHYHVERKINWANMQVHICPSTFFQIDASVQAFKMDHHQAGYQMIDVSHSMLNVSTHYIRS